MALPDPFGRALAAPSTCPLICFADRPKFPDEVNRPTTTATTTLRKLNAGFKATHQVVEISFFRSKNTESPTPRR